jgi:ATP/maltotriose-dependent transcriptional regulator MalT
LGERQRRTSTRQSTPTLREHTYVPQRLRDLLARGLEAGFAQVQAPAGCGKTAVVLQFLLDEEIDPHWHTCAIDDAEPAHLLAGLTKALGRAESVGGQTTLAALGSKDVGHSYRVALRPLLEEFDASHDAGSVPRHR